MPYAESWVHMMEILVICILHSVLLIIVNIQPPVFGSIILLAATLALVFESEHHTLIFIIHKSQHNDFYLPCLL